MQKLLILLFLFLCPTWLYAEFPSAPGQDPWANRPNDPKYKKMWQLFSHLPLDHNGSVSAWEQEHGSGMQVDKAWQLHTGNPDTLIAVVDSGIRWREKDLLDRHFLNRQELPLPEDSTSYDQNGDGRFSVSDYRLDSRVSDVNGNGVLDPGDLIKIFSDGIDSDKNGFVDDISGWDFHEHDNDPHDRIDFGHGTGEAKDSVAAINNGISGAGICGNCSVISLRVNDSFVVDSQAFAAAVYYATQNGAKLIQQALGGLNSSPFVQEAVNYAYDHGVPIIGSAADENSFHHNYPSTLDPIVYTNSVRYDTRDFQDANSFINFNNCSNYGARVDVATSGRSCSSEATGNLSGIAGLTLSYAQAQHKNLSPGELISLIKNGADDIDRGSNHDEPFRHSTYQGWDSITGYGRSNAYNMLKAVQLDKIPPEARIVSPEWFELYRESTFDEIPVMVNIALPRSGKMSVQLFIARGVETSNTPYKEIFSSGVTREALRGDLVNITKEIFAGLVSGDRNDIRNKDAYTLKLVVDDMTGNRSEARRTIFMFEDEYLHHGFPAKLRGSGESPGFFRDLDGDGKDEFITADGAGAIHAFASGGGEKGAFPFRGVRSAYSLKQASKSPPVSAAIFAPISGGDLEGDGSPDIVAATLEGDIIALDANGQLKPGFPVKLPFPDMTQVNKHQVYAQGVLAAPVIADIDANGTQEIIIAAMDGKLYVFDHTGRNHPGFPITVGVDGVKARLVSSPAVWDIDQDGHLDMVMGSNHVGEQAGYLFAISGRGTLAKNQLLAGFPVRIPMVRDKILPTIGSGIPTSPVIADIDNDGQRDILIHAFIGKSYLVNFDGSLKKSLSMRVGPNHNTNDTMMLSAFGHPAVGHLISKEALNPVIAGAGKRMLVNLMLGGRRYEFHHMVGAWDGESSTMLPSFPRKHDDMLLGNSPVMADLTGDGLDEVLLGSGGYFIHAFSQDGEAAGFPHFTGGWTYGAVSVGDFDGDSLLDVAATTREGYLFIWKTNAKKSIKSERLSWPTFKGNVQRTGAY